MYVSIYQIIVYLKSLQLMIIFTFKKSSFLQPWSRIIQKYNRVRFIFKKKLRISLDIKSIKA
jgi:hypothetical protein